jgi:ketosteroid isomerase-like protein
MSNTESQSAEGVITDQHHRGTAALSTGDLDSMMSVYADDVIMMPPNDAPRVGIAAVRSMWEELLQAFAVEVSVSVEEVEAVGEWAFERGTFRMKLTSKTGGAPSEDFGKYLDILKRQADGTWKYSRLMFNSSQPHPS